MNSRISAAASAHSADRREDRPVGQEHLLGLLAEVVAVDQQQVAEDPEEHERDRRHHRLRVPRGERVERVRDHRRRGDDGDELVDEHERVALQHRPARRAARRRRARARRGASRGRGRARAAPCRAAATARSARARPRRRRRRGSRTARRSSSRRSARRASAGRLYAAWSARNPASSASEAGPSAAATASADDGERRQPATSAVRTESSPRASGRSRLIGCAPVLLEVAHVVDEVRGARGGAVGANAATASPQRDSVAELRREEDAREEQQVLRPLARPAARRARRRAGRRGRWRSSSTTGASSGSGTEPMLVTVGAVDAADWPECDASRGAPAQRRRRVRRRLGGSTSSNRLPSPGLASRSSMRPPSACASSRAIARPRPVPPSSLVQNGRKIRSRSLGRDPGPDVADRDAHRAVLGRRARARSGRRRASSGTRWRAGSR